MASDHPVHQKFEFGTVFGDGGKVLARPAPREKKFFTPEEVEAIRAKAFGEGEASALARAQMAQAAALQALADAARQGLGHISETVHGYRAAAVQLALVCAQKIAAQALDRFPEAAVTAALEALAQELETATRLVLLANDPSEELKTAASEASTFAGFPGQIQFRDKPSLPKGAFEIVWNDGRAEFNPDQVAEALDKALSEALEAEVFHQSRAGHV